jgi:hypothetical protein
VLVLDGGRGQLQLHFLDLLLELRLLLQQQLFQIAQSFDFHRHARQLLQDERVNLVSFLGHGSDLVDKLGLVALRVVLEVNNGRGQGDVPDLYGRVPGKNVKTGATR